MKIAIVAPSPVPFTVGGAEKLWWGMLEYINKYTHHQCELIKLPTKEDTFWDLIDSYYKFYKLDLSYFDMIISTKYPAWMVKHHNHTLYLQHCLRGLYDTYHFTGLPYEIKTQNKKINDLIEMINKDSDIEEVFECLFDLKKDISIPNSIFSFPGPLIRLVVHYFDKTAMKKIKKFFAISQTVINRKEYFPANIKVCKIYHPSNLSNFHNEEYKYFFTASRLDEPKRIKWIVEAYKQTKTKIPLKIAGTGPLLNELKDLIREDDRIELLGFVSDKELIEYYANAYAIIFIPYDEDYGLITIEAMMSEKPVITFTDSGGVTEFLKHKITGLISNPSVELLAKNIDYISDSFELCKKMGKEAKKLVQNITWENTIKKLLGDLNEKNLKKNNQKINKITVVTTYPIYPPRGGGQNRIFYLYKELANDMTVDVVCLVNENEKYLKREIAHNLFEIRVPKTQKHAQKEWEIEKEAGIPITDIAMLYLYEETPLFIEEIKKASKESDFVIASHPYTIPILEKYVSIPIVYESHNVEYNLKQQMLKDTPYNQKLLKKLFEVEKKACLESKFTTVCAYDDALTFESIYGYDKSKAVVVPNGVDLDSVPYISKEKRYDFKNRLGLINKKIVLFIGSWHQPNIEAVEIIFDIAKKIPHYNFIVVGSVGLYFSSCSKPKNVGFAGVVDDDEKKMYLSIADIAINPMISGSGTNLKMLDYMASGTPVISTKVGARGLNIPSGYIVICDVKEFDYYILNIDNYVDVEKSRKYVEDNFSWKVIKNNLLIDLTHSSTSVIQ